MITRMRRDLPSGTVTFLFSDVEGSTKLLHELGAPAYAEALAEHRRIVRRACAAHNGVEVDTQGDAFFVAFASAPDAARAAADTLAGLAPGPIRVRVGLHTGNPHLTDEGYVGEDVHLAARIAGSAHGGQAVCSSRTRELVDAEVLDLGEHRLKDFAEPVSIYQLGVERFPPLKTISNTNLPRPASSFVGREREVGELRALLQDGARLITLTGPGGSGKTRLALAAATELVTEFKAGVFWVGLASLRDAALVLETVAQTLGAKDGVAEHVGERELLLLLDNLEQVIDAGPELAALLEACPNLALLVTSRELLRVRGEVEYPVAPLADPEAVALFCARSQLDPDDTVRDLCRRLDNLPLALELAAARTRVLSPAQTLERLGQRLDLLRGGRDADPRQQTLRATIAWSYELLSDDEQTLFARLAVFSGGCTLDAAEEVAGADLDVLQSLVEKSLVRHTGERFWMLETIREFALERLDASAERESLRQRHAEWFLALAEEAAPNIQWYSTEWIERLEREHDNLRAALEHLDGEPALRLAGALRDFWIDAGYVPEGRRRLESALEVDGHPSAARADALNGLAEIAYRTGDSTTARVLAEEALELHRRFGNPWGAAHALNTLGVAFVELGDFERARRACEESVVLFRQAGDSRYAVGVTRTLAFTYHSRGDHEVARARHEANLHEIRELGLKEMEAATLGSLSMIALEQGRKGDAHALRNESLLVWQEVGSPQGIAQAICHAAAELAILQGDAASAARLLGWFDAQRDQLGVSEAWVARMNERTLAAIRAQLDEASIGGAWDEGTRLTAEEAVALVLD
jgi:predicted ATPase/class 3 adenylate cyclase